MTPLIRPMVEADHDAFLTMWSAFVATDPNEPGNSAMGPENWARVMDPANPMQGLVARDDTGTPLGFAVYLTFPFSWSMGEVCYLLDLFVTETARGQRIGEALIHAMEDIGRAKGWYKIFWMTQAQNHSAQRLYERVAVRRDYIRYDLELDAP